MQDKEIEAKIKSFNKTSKKVKTLKEADKLAECYTEVFESPEVILWFQKHETDSLVKEWVEAYSKFLKKLLELSGIKL